MAVNKRERRELRRKRKREEIARRKEQRRQGEAALLRSRERAWEEEHLWNDAVDAMREHDYGEAAALASALAERRPDLVEYWALLLRARWCDAEQRDGTGEAAGRALSFHPEEPLFQFFAVAARALSGDDSAWYELEPLRTRRSVLPDYRDVFPGLMRELAVYSTQRRPLAPSKRAAAPRPARHGPPAAEAPRASPAPAEAAAPAVAAPAPLRVEIPVALALPAWDGLAAAVAAGRDSLEELLLSEAAAEILLADQYDRLLCLPALRGVEHLPHQIETVTKVLRKFHGRVLLSDEVGLGKTIEAALVMKELFLRGQCRRALVICPPALVSQWESELSEKFGIESITTSRGLFRDDPDGFWSQGPVLLASLGVARSPRHRERLQVERFDLVVLDEAHHLKNRATVGYQVASALKSRYLLMLTATPVETDLGELYNLVTLLRPGTLGTEAEFRRRFVNPGDPAAPRDAESLRALLSDVMIRNTRAVSGVVLPPRTARTVAVPMGDEESALYASLLALLPGATGRDRTLVRLLLEEAGSSPDAVARTVESVGAGGGDERLGGKLPAILPLARRVAATRKIDALPDLLRGDKALVFTRFDATFDRIAAHLAARGIPFVPFRGSMAASERDAAVAAFEREVPVMLCSEVGGEGRNLQFCHRLVNFDLPWNPMKIEQRIGRVHRIGQKQPVEIVNLCAQGTIEERILDVLESRINLFELVVGEMDLILGDLEEEREFGERVLDIYAGAAGEEDVDKGFALLADRLATARGRLERTKALDAALFGDDYAG